jgi:murein DD-endopeptidase MepM/ murein hydrolase activator NlpD
MAFPLTFVPKDDWHVPPRSFGAPRSKGKRKHAGCDLYAPVGTNVHAVAGGKIAIHRAFYLGTHATVIEHDDGFVVRYGEVQKGLANGLKVGDRVKKGDVIGKVGRLSGLSISMIHFEMYSGSVKGELTKKGPFFRRSDLMDPTQILDEWAKEPLPK